MRVMPAHADGVTVLSGFPSGSRALPLLPVAPNSHLFSSLQLGCKNLQQSKPLAMRDMLGCGTQQRGVPTCEHQFRCMDLFASLSAPISRHARCRRKGAHPKSGCSLQTATDGLNCSGCGLVLLLLPYARE